jgi:DNA-binding CsgD family transcriptional regulator
MTSACTSSPPSSLTGQELLVLQLLARGYTPAQIGALIDLQPHRVIEVIGSAATHLGSRDGRAAVMRAYALKLIIC